MASPSPTPAPSPPPPLSEDQNPNHHEPLSPSPSPTQTPYSPKTLRAISSAPKKPQPLPWSHQETVNLIEAYQEKWYSQKRGPLKASQWEEIAVTVAARCGYDEPSKTAIQCRHKLEKLRKRYRAEKQRPNPNAWEFFDLMHLLEHGPLPISARPMNQYQNSVPRNQDENNNYELDEEEEEEEEEEVNEAKYNDRNSRNKRNLSGHVNTNKRKLSGGSARVSGVLDRPMLRKRKERYESEGEEEEEEGQEEEGEEEEVVVGGGGRGMVGELAAEIKAFAERFVRMESKKMEMMRETERYRMEMENKRMEMILESQRKIVDSIGRALGSHLRS